MTNQSKKSDIDDVIAVIGDLATRMDEQFVRFDERFDKVDEHFERVDSRLDNIELEIRKIHTDQAEMRQWLESIDNRILGIESDIKEIYDRIVVLGAKAPNLNKSEQIELSHKLESMINWAKLVSEKTGIALPKF